MKLDYVYTIYRGKKMGFLFEDMHLTEAHFFYMEEDEPESRIGDICTAVVEKVVPAIDGIFLDGPDNIKLFMHLQDSAGRELILRRRGRRKGAEIRTGDTVLVQITADAQKNKQYEASFNLSLTGDSIIVNRTGQTGVSKKIRDEKRREDLKNLMQEILRKEDPEGGYGVIVRTAADSYSDEEISKETKELLSKLRKLILSAETAPEFKTLFRQQKTVEDRLKRLASGNTYEEMVFHTDLSIDDALIPQQFRIHRIMENESSPLVIFNIPVLLEKALGRKVFLKDGGYLYIDPTEAMTVIDVNSGKSIKGGSHEERALAENKIAATEIARQLRLRNISGIILIDFISMKKTENEKELMNWLKQITASDPCQVHVVDMTRLGLVEMTRKKQDAPLKERLSHMQ